MAVSGFLDVGVVLTESPASEPSGLMRWERPAGHGPAESAGARRPAGQGRPALARKPAGCSDQAG